MPLRALTPGVVFMAWPLLGVNAYAIRPVDAVPALAARAVPLLVIHGEQDVDVRVEHGRRLAAAYDRAGQSLPAPQRAGTYFVPGARHLGGYKTDPAAYLARLTSFLDRLPGPHPLSSGLSRVHGIGARAPRVPAGLAV